jgi:uncharacterized protein YjbJ (UPF0337 family)
MAEAWNSRFCSGVLDQGKHREAIMDKETIKGGVKKATGAVKDKVGQMTGDRDMQAEGKADKAEGRVRGAVGHAKDAVREIIGKK